MHYVSTRGGDSPIGFQQAVMTGLARDGGLLLPAAIPDVRAQLPAWRRLAYRELAFEVMRLFADLPEADLRRLIAISYAAFDTPEVVAVVPVGELYLLELFHGPTLAFKDVALQFLGALFEELLRRRGGALNILAATSGDTGSAAIYGVKGKDRIRIFVMHPHGRVSPLQERQMTTVPDANVFNLAIEGTFDDCQNILKAIFRDLEFRDRYALGAVNSINWARVLAQMVYYFYAAFRVMERTGADRVRFAVPTGNFGDIFAGYLAARMGLPVSRLLLATNENDILARFFATGVYRRGPVQATLSPSMDIQVASNFERYLFYRAEGDAARVRAWMEAFNRTGALVVPPLPSGRIDDWIAGGTGNREQTLATIRLFAARHGYLLDPHTAVGVHVGLADQSDAAPLICLATAHPAKFSAAIQEATGKDLARHPDLDALRDRPTRCAVLPADAQAVRTYLTDKIAA
jgi:threonine synthase